MAKIEIEQTELEELKQIAQYYIDGQKEIDELKKLCAMYKVNFELIVYCVLGFTGVFGLNDQQTGMIRDSILTGEESPMQAIMKQMTSLMTDAGMAQFSKEKERQMKERFSFFGYLPDVSRFYGHQKQYRVTIPDQLLQGLPQRVIENLTK